MWVVQELGHLSDTTNFRLQNTVKAIIYAWENLTRAHLYLYFTNCAVSPRSAYCCVNAWVLPKSPSDILKPDPATILRPQSPLRFHGEYCVPKRLCIFHHDLGVDSTFVCRPWTQGSQRVCRSKSLSFLSFTSKGHKVTAKAMNRTPSLTRLRLDPTRPTTRPLTGRLYSCQKRKHCDHDGFGDRTRTFWAHGGGQATRLSWLSPWASRRWVAPRGVLTTVPVPKAISLS